MQVGIRLESSLETYHRFDSLWEEVVLQLMANDNVSSARARDMVYQLFRGLVCKAYTVNPMRLSFPPIIDRAWHSALLNTELYREFCIEMFGRFLDHSTASARDPLEEKNKRVTLTMQTYADVFGETPPGDLWIREEPLENPRRAVPAVAPV